MKTLMAWIGLVVFLVGISSSSYAGYQSGKITGLSVRSDGLIWVVLEGTHTGKPACATGNYWMIKDENSEYGKKQYSMILAAYLSGKIVYIDGDNLCTRWPDGENIKTLAF
jgi:hypothetical protein